MSEPVLSAEEWASAKAQAPQWLKESPFLHAAFQYYSDTWGHAEYVEDIPAVIALLNAALPDGHPAKITREWVAELRAVAEQLPTMGAGPNGEDIPDPMLSRMAEALESYLPPP